MLNTRVCMSFQKFQFASSTGETPPSPSILQGNIALRVLAEAWVSTLSSGTEVCLKPLMRRYGPELREASESVCIRTFAVKS